MSYQQKKIVTGSFISSLMFSIIGLGGIMLIYLHSFLHISPQDIFRMSSNKTYYPARITIVPQKTPENITQGEQLYQSSCISCHGIIGEYQAGLLGPDLIDGQWLHYNNEQDIFQIIGGGVGANISVSGNLMPARAGVALKDEAVWKIIYYLSSINSTIVQDSVATEASP